MREGDNTGRAFLAQHPRHGPDPTEQLNQTRTEQPDPAVPLDHPPLSTARSPALPTFPLPISCVDSTSSASEILYSPEEAKRDAIEQPWQYGALSQAMEEPHSVSSPRRILSLSRKKRASSVSFVDSSADKASGFGVSGEHGPKTSEVYGFVGSITTIVATVIFLAWAYVPEPWLHAIGIFYYPNRYWALAIPVYIMMTIVLALGFYVGLNFMSTPPPTSLNTLFDEFSREPSSPNVLTDGDELPIEPISDIGIDEINKRMFGGVY